MHAVARQPRGFTNLGSRSGACVQDMIADDEESTNSSNNSRYQGIVKAWDAQCEAEDCNIDVVCKRALCLHEQ